LAALVTLLISQTGMPPRVDRKLHEDLGQALAQEALKLLGPTGKVTVITRDTGSFPQPATDLSLASFTRAIGKAGATLKAVQALQEDPLRPVQVPPGDFFELIRRGATGDVLVSFMGPPLLLPEQRAVLGEIKPWIVAFCSGSQPEQLNLRLLAEQNLLHAAVLSRPFRKLVPGRESFADLYVRAEAAELVKPLALAGQP